MSNKTSQTKKKAATPRNSKSRIDVRPILDANREGLQVTASTEIMDKLIMLAKTRVYKALTDDHAEQALELLRIIATHLHNRLQSIEVPVVYDQATDTVQVPDQITNEVYKPRWEAYLHWLRANYFHLLGEEAKAQYHYAEATNRLQVTLETYENSTSPRSRLEQLMSQLLHADLGDLYWYGDRTDMAGIAYQKVRMIAGIFLSTIDREWGLEAGDGHTISDVKIWERLARDVDGMPAPMIQGIRPLPELMREQLQEMLSRRIAFSGLRGQFLDNPGANHESVLTYADHLGVNRRQLWFLVGQAYASQGLYVKARQYLLWAVLAETSESDMDYLWRDASLAEVVNNSLSARYAACYLLSKLMSYFPEGVDWSTGEIWDTSYVPDTAPCNRGLAFENPQQIVRKKLEFCYALKTEISDFLGLLKTNPTLIKILEFIEASRSWVENFYHALLSSINKGTEFHPPEDLLSKLAYTQTNAYYLFKDFLSRKREFEDTGYSKLFTPAVNVVPRDKNVFTVLKRWNSLTPMIMRGRKIAVTTRRNEWPEDLRDGADFATRLSQNPYSRGGGYFLRWYGTGIVIDPGIYFFENFLEFYSFRDIDLVIVTHDHPDHQMDFKSLFALMSQSRKADKVEKPIDFWIDPGSCAEFYSYILRLHAQEEQRAEEEVAQGKSLTPRLIGNIYPFYRDESDEQNSDNDVNRWKIPCKVVGSPIEIKAIYNKKHKTLMSPRQSFGILIKLPMRDTRSRIVYVTGDGGFDDKNTVKWVEQNLRHWAKERVTSASPEAGTATTSAIDNVRGMIDLLVPHLGSIIDGDLTDVKEFDKGLYPSHLGMRGLVELVRRFQPKVVVISEFGEEIDGQRKRFSSHVDYLSRRQLIWTRPLSDDISIQLDEYPERILPGDIGLTLDLGTIPDGRDGDDFGFVCRLCFRVHPRTNLVVHTSGQELLYVCKDCRDIFLPTTERGATPIMDVEAGLGLLDSI